MNDLTSAFEADVVGRPCRVRRREHDWDFDLQNGRGLAVSCHWRIVSSDGIALTEEDDKQWFGLAEPIDAAMRATALFAGATVTSVKVDQTTADLCLGFSNGLRLDLFNNSAGYEGWKGSFMLEDGRGCSIIALGGGGLSFF